MTISVQQAEEIAAGGYSGSFTDDVPGGDSVVLIATGYNPDSTFSSSDPEYGGEAVTGATQLLEDTSQAGDTGTDAGTMWLLPDVAGGSAAVSLDASSYGTNSVCGLIGLDIAGLGAAPALDQSVITAGTSDAPSCTTGDITQAPEIVIGFLVQANGALESGPGEGWTGPVVIADAANCQAWYQIPVTDGAAYSMSFTLASSTPWVCGIATIYAGSGGTPHTRTAALTVEPSFQATPASPHAALTVTPVFGSVHASVVAPLPEVFGDLASAVVTSGGTDAPARGTAEDLTVSGSTFPYVAAGVSACHGRDFAAPSELFLITAADGDAVAVVRGWGGTTPVTHSDGFVLTQVAPASWLNSVASLVSAPFAANALAPGTGITADVEEGQAAAINAWLLGLAAGTKAWFPVADYYLESAIEVPRGIAVEGAMYGYDTPQFIALPGFTGCQMLRNWQSTDPVNPAGEFYAPNTTAWNSSRGNNYVNLRNLTFNPGNNSNITCVGLVHIQERAVVEFLTVDSTGSSGSGFCGLAVFSNSEDNGITIGRLVIRLLTGYGQGWNHFIYADGTNGETATGVVIDDLEIEQFTTPANAAGVSLDSPVYARAVNRLRLTGHQEQPPAAGADTAAIRLVNCNDVLVHDYFYSPGYAGTGNEGAYRPFIRATQDTGGSDSLPASQVGPVLRNVTISGGVWSSRTDASCGITSGSATVTDASITASDLYRPVNGPGIPSGAYITAVDAGTSFTLSADAWLTGTVSLQITCNPIEDETASGGTNPGSGVIRHFQVAPNFEPEAFIGYSGTEVRYTQYPYAGAAVIKTARSLVAADDAAAWAAPSGAVAESFPRRYGAPAADTTVLASGTLHLTAVYMYPGDLVTNLTYWSGATAMDDPAHWWFAFFDAGLNLVAISADQTTAGWAASTGKTLAMAAPWAAMTPGPHYSGIMVDAATPPSLEAVTEGNVGAAPPYAAGSSSTGLTTPSTCPLTAAALTYVAGRPYVLVT